MSDYLVKIRTAPGKWDVVTVKAACHMDATAVARAMFEPRTVCGSVALTFSQRAALLAEYPIEWVKRC
jgi:hypothetical protein